MITNIREFFDDHFPADLQRELLRSVVKAYGDAFDECEGLYLPEECHDLVGYVRRAKIEQSLQRLGDRNRARGVAASVELNSVENWHHRRITAGRVTFTASAVENPKRLPRPAEFRATLARSSQLCLRGFGENVPEPAPNDLLYGLLIHYPEQRMRNQLPAFVQMVFPDPDCREYIARVDLMARYPDLVSVTSADQDDVSPEPNIRIRTDTESEEERA